MMETILSKDGTPIAYRRSSVGPLAKSAFEKLFEPRQGLVHVGFL